MTNQANLESAGTASPQGVPTPAGGVAPGQPPSNGAVTFTAEQIAALEPMIEKRVQSIKDRRIAELENAVNELRSGIPVQMITKRIGKGSPDILDVILRGTVHGVINTPGIADKEILDGLEIRRAAVERGIPCITSIDTAKAMVAAMAKANDVYSVQPIAAYRQVGFGY